MQGKVYTLKEVASELKLSYHMVFNLVHSGKIKAVRFGNHWRVTESELERVKESGADNE